MNEDSEWLGQRPTREQEWLRQLSLIYSGLILIGVYMVQPFLTAASLDLSAMVCVVAFSVAIPAPGCPGASQSAGSLPSSRDHLSPCHPRKGGRAESRLRWRGRRLLAHPLDRRGGDAGRLVAVAVHSAGYTRLEQGQEPPPQEGDEPGDTES
jgi:hypothetical protein